MIKTIIKSLCIAIMLTSCAAQPKKQEIIRIPSDEEPVNKEKQLVAALYDSNHKLIEIVRFDRAANGLYIVNPQVIVKDGKAYLRNVESNNSKDNYFKYTEIQVFIAEDINEIQ